MPPKKPHQARAMGQTLQQSETANEPAGEDHNARSRSPAPTLSITTQVPGSHTYLLLSHTYLAYQLRLNDILF